MRGAIQLKGKLNAKKEINYVIEESLKGDVNSIEKLLSMLDPMIISSIKKYYYKNDDFYDLVQDGYIKILESLDLYDKDKGVHFLGFVKSKLKYYYLSKNRKDKEIISLNQIINDNSERNELLNLLEDTNVNIENSFINNELNKLLHEALSTLSVREREVIVMCYFKKMNMYSIADKLGIAYRTVVNTKVNAINKLRKNLS